MTNVQPAVVRPRDWRAPLRLVIGLTSATLLLSIGGAQAVAAPISLPALWWATRTARSRVTRVLLIVVASLTALITGWIVGYLLGREPEATVAGVAGCLIVTSVFLLTALPRGSAQ